MSEPMEPFLSYFRKRDKEVIDLIAATDGISRGAVVRMAVVQYAIRRGLALDLSYDDYIEK